MQRFLIVRFSSIGDIVLTTPVVRCLKQQVKNCEVHYLTKKSFAPVLQHNPYVDKLFSINKDVDEVLQELKKNKYDLIIDLHHNLRTFQLKRKLSVPSVSFNKLNLEKWLMVNFKINRLPDQHIVHRYFKTVEKLNVKYDGKGLDYFIPKEEEVPQEKLTVSHRSGYIAIVIGAKHATKQFPAEKTAELITKLAQPVILLGGKEDAALADRIITLCDEQHKSYIYNACGLYSLNQSASIVKNAKLVVTNDTGLMHIAAAFNKNIISIWGNTIPEFGMTPFQPDGSRSINAISEIKNLYCRPCSKIGYEKCPKGHFKCMLEQDVEKIIGQFENLKI
jgi:ADP-heptose:LPS heptosyltransferase